MLALYSRRTKRVKETNNEKPGLVVGFIRMWTVVEGGAWDGVFKADLFIGQELNERFTYVQNA